MSLKFGSLLLAALVGIGITYYWFGPHTSPTPPSPARRFVLFVDVTTSARANQRSFWTSHAEQIFAELKPGDALSIHQISDNTAESAPIFDREIPVCGYGMLKTIECKRRLSEFKKLARDSFQSVLAGESKAKSTAILSVFDQIKPDSARQTLVVTFSDMLNSAPSDGAELNLERSLLTDERIPKLITEAAKRHRWHSRSLESVDFFVVLPSLDPGDAKPLNDRQMLRFFFGQAISAMGGNLKSFDSQFNPALLRGESNEK